MKYSHVHHSIIRNREGVKVGFNFKYAILPLNVISIKKTRTYISIKDNFEKLVVGPMLFHNIKLMLYYNNYK